jgi:hypothetical protein
LRRFPFCIFFLFFLNHFNKKVKINCEKINEHATTTTNCRMGYIQNTTQEARQKDPHHYPWKDGPSRNCGKADTSPTTIAGHARSYNAHEGWGPPHPLPESVAIIVLFGPV